MCISITEADAIRISMHSQWYNTYEEATDTMRCDTIYPYYDAVRFDSTQCDSMQYDAMEKKYDAMQFNMVQIFSFYFFGSDNRS